MTDQPAGPAALIRRWRELARVDDACGNAYRDGRAASRRQCADQLEAALTAGTRPPEPDALQALKLLLCADCAQDHLENTQSVSCYCPCHNSDRDEANARANGELLASLLAGPDHD